MAYLTFWHYVYTEYWFVFAAVAAAYLPAVKWGMATMERREPRGLKRALFWWNALMLLSNGYCFVLLTRLNARAASRRAFADTVCENTALRANATDGELFALGLFCFLKVPEMLDTAFLVARKRTVSVLHVWHHFSVMLFCWSVMHKWQHGVNTAEGSYFGMMNGLVHAVMYGYYAVTSQTRRRSAAVAHAITVLQLAQFAAGLALQYVVTFRCPGGARDAPGGRPWQELWFGWLVYGSYLALFLDYYVRRYFGVSGGWIDGGRKRKARTSGEDAAKTTGGGAALSPINSSSGKPTRKRK